MIGIGGISYGIVDMELTNITMLREPIMSEDGIDYICTKVAFQVAAMWTPTGTSYATLLGNVPQRGPAYAGRTDRVLLEYLSQPRLPLSVYFLDADGQRVAYLSSPTEIGGGKTLPCDVRGGPFSRNIVVNEKHGIKTWMVTATFETFLNECLDRRTPVISHRWSKGISHDEDYYQTIVTKGIVEFHAGRLYDAGQSPDWYRSQFFSRVPQNFTRTHIDVDVASDNSRATYTITDTENAYNLGTGAPASRLEAHLTCWHSQGSIWEAAGDAAPTVNQNSWDTIFHPWRAPANLMGNLRAFSGAMQAQLPQYYGSFSCRMWGGRNSARYDLMRYAWALATTCLGVPSLFSTAQRTEMIASQSLHQKELTFEMTMRWSQSTLSKLFGAVGPIGPLVHNVVSIFTNDIGLQFFSNYFPVSEDFDNLSNVPNNTYLSQKPVGNRPVNPPPWNNGASSFDIESRGPGYTKYLLMQALSQQCVEPPEPGYGNILTGSVNTDANQATQLVPTYTPPSLPAAPPIPPAQ